MTSIVVVVLSIVLLFEFCTALQCTFFLFQRTPPPGLKDSPGARCHLPGLDFDLRPGETYTNMTSCVRCHCAGDLTAYCCALTWSYEVPDECTIVTKDCVQKIIYKSDGSPCEPIVMASRK